jgi:transglutaminase-like putative cysteine protease
MFRFASRVLLNSLALLVFGLPAVSTAESRQWQNDAGTQWIEAEFVNVAEGNAYLRKGDGSLVKAPVDRLSRLDQDYLSALAKGEDTSLLPTRKELAALAVEAEANRPYVITRSPAKSVKATFRMSVKSPTLTAKEWVVFASNPPRTDGQSATAANLLPDGTKISERGSSQRTLLQSRIGATSAGTEKSITVAQVISADLYPRPLEEASGEKPEVPYLDRIERDHYTSPTSLMDLHSPVFQQWLTTKKLFRTNEESQIDFARRAYLLITGSFRYSYSPEMDRIASHLCHAGTSDCGGVSILFSTVLRANGIPARLLAGRWAKSSEKGEILGSVEYYQQHVKSEFYAEGVGWVPVDVSRGIGLAPEESLRYFGNDRGDFITLHFDHDVELDTLYFGKKTVTWLQGIKYWVTGSGDLSQAQQEYSWEVQEESSGEM